MAMGLFDTHTHLMSESYDEDREALIAEMFLNGGVTGIIECATENEDMQAVCELAERHEGIYFAAGVHPHSASEYDEETEERIRMLLKHKKAVAVGEIGLDYHYDFSPRPVQREVLGRQIAIANELSMPVILHNRESAEDMLHILKEARPNSGVIHSFSENADYMQEMLALGMYIGFGGVVTFKNRQEICEAARLVPLERLLIETDCPYLTPVPFRGKRNRSDYTLYTARKIAELHGCGEEEIIAAAEENAKRLFLAKKAIY